MADSPEILNYTNSTRALRRANTVRILSIISLAFAWLALLPAGMIEYYNFKSDQVLPMVPLPAGARHAWRLKSKRGAEASWRSRNLRSPADPAWETRPLTAAERAALAPVLARIDAEAQLSDAVFESCIMLPFVVVLIVAMPPLIWFSVSKSLRIMMAASWLILLAVCFEHVRLGTGEAFSRLID